jgi:hypothetical protein
MDTCAASRVSLSLESVQQQQQIQPKDENKID